MLRSRFKCGVFSVVATVVGVIESDIKEARERVAPPVAGQLFFRLL